MNDKLNYSSKLNFKMIEIGPYFRVINYYELLSCSEKGLKELKPQIISHILSLSVKLNSI